MAGTFNVKTGRWVQAATAQRRARPAKRRPRSDDEILAAAIADGRVPPSRRAHYARELRRDPRATRALVASLAAGLTPSERELLHGGDPDAAQASAEGSWITPPRRTAPGTIFSASGRVVVAGSPLPAAARPAPPDRFASTQNDPPAPAPAPPAQAAMRPRRRTPPGTVFNADGYVVATA
jgi:hypothetical protein